MSAGTTEHREGSSRMPEIRALKPVSLREAWPDEARHFTPWLADNIDLLGAKLDLRLDQVQER